MEHFTEHSQHRQVLGPICHGDANTFYKMDVRKSMMVIKITLHTIKRANRADVLLMHRVWLPGELSLVVLLRMTLVFTVMALDLLGKLSPTVMCWQDAFMRASSSF